MEREGIKIVSINDTQGGKNIVERFNKFIREKQVGNIIIEEDFNVRIVELGGGSMEERDRERHSKDKVVGNRGGNFIEWIREKGWYILNGRTEGDWEKFTYVGARGSSVIDQEL